MSWKFNPYSPCCCHDGTYCVTPVGCLNSDEYGGAFYTEFPISLVETATGMDAPGSPTTASQADPACFTLAGGTEYTLTIAKDRWTTYAVTFTTPCADSAWSLNPQVQMVPAEGYACPCILNMSPPCVDPVKLPLILNDGFGDVPLVSGALGECVQRTAHVGAVDCFSGPTADVSVPVVIRGNNCDPSIVPVRWNEAADAYGHFQTVIVGGDCDPPRGACSPFISQFPCGALNSSSLSVQCSPYVVTALCTFIGCLREIYGPSATITIMESP